MHTRRSWFRIAFSTGAAWLIAPQVVNAAGKPAITVYRSPTCGCCEDWSKHLAANGFVVRTETMTDMDPIKIRFAVPEDMMSCHTGVIGGYAVEGHVPAELIHKMLREKPRVAGIAVPGMPMGSPGMEGTGAHAGHKEAYNVYLFERNGRTMLYAKR